MDMKYVLFSSKGRIGSRTFLRGFSIVTAAFMLFQIAGTFVAAPFAALTYPMVYVYACLFSKRLHDAGRSAWYFLLFLLGHVVVSNVSGALLMPILSPEAFARQEEVMAMIAQAMDRLNDPVVVQNLQDALKEFEQLNSLTTLASFLFSSALLGFIAARLPTDPDSNEYGPPTRTSYLPDQFS